jgi:plastocyanin
MRHVRSRRRFLTAALMMATGFVIAGSPTPAPASDVDHVEMVDNEPDLTRWHFDPAQLTVPVGTTVTWLNKGREDHSVTADDKSFDSGLKKSGTTFQRAFPKAGKFSYHCEPHPWMTGTIEVSAAATPTSAAAPTTVPTSPPTTAAAAPSTAASSGGQSPAETATSASPADSEPPSSGSGDDTAAPASSRKRSGGHLAGTLALVLGPTLAGLALGARLRRRKAGG